jgi:hypothetical protein
MCFGWVRDLVFDGNLLNEKPARILDVLKKENSFL